MATTKSLNTLVAELRAFLRAYNRSLDTGDTSLARDLLITPYSVGARAVMDQVMAVKDLHILSKLTGQDLLDEATNYGLEQKQGTFAVVTLTFYSTTIPTTTVTIPKGVQCRTTGTPYAAPVTFSTIADATYPTASLPVYYSYDRARYEFSIAATADSVGTSGNVGSDTIGTLVTPISQISGVTNLTGSSGGTGVEDDDDLRERIRLAMTGRDINTVNGLREFATTHGVTDAYCVRVEDADAERPEGVDVFVIDPYGTAVSDTFTYQGPTYRHYFAYAPVTAVTSVVDAGVGAISSSDYDVSIDDTTILRRSTEAPDYMTVRSSAGVSVGSPITVTYTYSQLVSNLQNTVNQDTTRILTTDVLIKRAFPLYFYINASLTLVGNADGPTTRTRVRNALTQFFSNYRLGNDIQKSDLVIVLQQGYGDFPVSSVDAVVINSYYLQDEFGTTYNPSNDVIMVDNKHYVVYGAATIV